MQKIRVGVAGVGFIGKAHIDALRRLPGVEVTAIAERDEETAKRLADQLGVPRGYGDFQKMIAEVDAVHNCTPNAQHNAVNIAAIDAGRHIYAEKPLADTARDAFDIWRRAEAAGVLHGLNHQYRMYPAVQQMRSRVRGGDMGDVFLISGRYHQQSGLYATDYGWRMTEGGMSCGLSDIGTHWIDTARCVTGKRIERVLANVQTIHPERTKQDGTRVKVHTDDLSTALLVFEGGAQGILSVSKVAAGHMNDLALGVDGQNFSLYWEQESPSRIRIGYKNAPNMEILVAPALLDPENRDLCTLPGGHPLGFNDALVAALRDFYAAARGEITRSEMRCATFEDGFEGMAFVEAAVKSGKSGRWETVERPG